MSKRKRAEKDEPKIREKKKARQGDSDSMIAISRIEGEEAVTNGMMAKGTNSLEPLVISDEAASSMGWSVSSSGGQILDLSPVFSSDEKYYMLAYNAGVKVFSCRTSSLVQYLSISRETPIIGFAVSPSQPTEIVVGLATGQIQRWKWLNGVKEFEIDTGESIVALAVVGQKNAEDVWRDTVVVAHGAQDPPWKIVAHRMDGDGKSEDGTILYKSQLPLETLQVADSGRFIIATEAHRVIIGRSLSAENLRTSHPQYKWNEFTCTDTVVSIKGYVSVNFIPNTASTEQQSSAGIDLAVGTKSGIVYLYRDVVHQLESAAVYKQPPPVIRLHWHRNAVAALDWSKDGNYLISGGEESVLVLWQLDRLDKSFLPHLSSAIRRIVVSPSGTLYGVTLEDNSSMVLEVFNLEPRTSIPEPQLFPSKKTLRDLTRLGHLDQLKRTLPNNRSPLSVASQSSKIMFVTQVPNVSNSDVKLSKLSSYLHVYDYKRGTQVTKQALAPTLATEQNVDMLGTPLDEPTIALLKLSSDDQWLATVDEWLPLPENANRPPPIKGLGRKARLTDLESHLRFWRWNDADNLWDLVEKVSISQSLHTPFLYRNRITLDLIEGRSQAEFFTLGEDCVVRSWSLVSRVQYGTAAKTDAISEGEHFTCQTVGSVPLPGNSEEAQKLSARMSINNEGSLLLVAISTGQKSIASVLEISSRKILCTYSDCTSGPIRSVHMVGSKAIVLSDALAAWDIVSSSPCHLLDLEFKTMCREERRLFSHVASNRNSGQIAIALPTSRGYTDITIMAGTELKQQNMISLPFLVLSLQPTPAQGGFLAINSDSEMVHIAHSGVQGQSLPGTVAPVQQTVLHRIYGDIKAFQFPLQNVATRPRPGSHASAATRDVRYSSDIIHRVFSHSQPLSSPPVLNMFRQVAATLSQDLYEAER